MRRGFMTHRTCLSLTYDEENRHGYRTGLLNVGG